MQTDLAAFFERLAPKTRPYVHDTEGPDDMPAHIRAALTQTHALDPRDRRRDAARHLAGHLSCSSTARARTRARWCCI